MGDGGALTTGEWWTVPKGAKPEGSGRSRRKNVGRRNGSGSRRKKPTVVILM
jgi:hypothetical protein